MEAFLSPEGCPESPQIGDSVNQLCDGLYLKYRKPHHEKRKLMNSIQYVEGSSQGNIFLFIALQWQIILLKSRLVEELKYHQAVNMLSQRTFCKAISIKYN